MKRLFTGLLVILLFMLPVLSACTTSTTSSTTESTPLTTSSTVAPTSTTSTSVITPTTSPTVSATETTPAPATINIAVNGQITSLDPTIMANSTPNYAGLENVFEHLINFDTNNKMVGNLADSWSFSPDFLTLTVNLKQGIKFSTGDPLTAADVKFSFDKYASLPGPVSAQLTQNFTGLQVIDDYTIEFTFPAINVQFLPQTIPGVMILSKTQYDRLGEAEWVKNPAGTGPYKFSGFREGQYVDLTYNDQYRGPKPQITDAHFVYTSDPNTRLSQFVSGEVDLIMDVLPSSVNKLQQEGYNRYDIVQAHAICLQFDLLNPDAPWVKKEVREAIDYVIDKDQLNKAVFGGVLQKGAWQMTWELGYDSSLDPAYSYDLTKARSLMDQSGYPNGFDMTLYYPSYQSWAQEMVDYLSGTLAQIGINVKPISLSNFGTLMGQINGLYKDHTQTGVILLTTGWPGNPDPVINLTNGFYSLKDNTLIDNTQLDDLIKQALETPDDAQRAQIVDQAYQIINDQLPFIPIALQVVVYMSKSNITYTPSIGGMNASPTNLFDLKIQ